MGRKLKITVPVRTLRKEYVDTIVQKIMAEHTDLDSAAAGADPHPQYTTHPEAQAITNASVYAATRFVTAWKWS